MIASLISGAFRYIAVPTFENARVALCCECYVLKGFKFFCLIAINVVFFILYNNVLFLLGELFSEIIVQNYTFFTLYRIT